MRRMELGRTVTRDSLHRSSGSDSQSSWHPCSDITINSLRSFRLAQLVQLPMRSGQRGGFTRRGKRDLVVALERLGEGVVDDKSNIRLVDTHPKGNGGGHDMDPIGGPVTLDTSPVRRVRDTRLQGNLDEYAQNLSGETS